MKLLQKVFQIIELLKSNKEMKLQEIVDELGMHKSTAHRLTAELCANGYLQKNAGTKTYQLGMKFLDISSHIIDRMDIREIAKQGIKELNAITKETIHLAVLADKQVIYTDKRESVHAIRMYSQIGKVAPFYCTGVGKIILAFQPAEVIDELLSSFRFQKHTPNTIVTRKALMKELAEIRKNGFGFDREEHELHVGCIAAPVRDHTRNVVASISVTAVLYEMSMEKLAGFKDLLLATCADISGELGYREGLDDKGRVPGKNPSSRVRKARPAAGSSPLRGGAGKKA
jgi:DNA-binding IclR family transcriptional regulator